MYIWCCQLEVFCPPLKVIYSDELYKSTYLGVASVESHGPKHVTVGKIKNLAICIPLFINYC